MRAELPGGVDCDVHPALPGLTTLLPYLDPYWQEQVTVRGIDGLDLSSFPPQMAAHGGSGRRDGAAKPGTSLETLRTEALDAFGSELAVCNPLYGTLAIHNEHFAAAVARAINQWLVVEWLDQEPRLRASITVAAQNAEYAVDEIDRCAGDARFVQVLLLSQVDAPLGNRRYWPIYAAAERHGLSVGVHAGSNFRHATTSNGWPSYHLEDYVAHAQAFQANLLSLVHEGVFTKFPGVKFVLLESGFTWMPTFLWRADKTWRGVHTEVPWVDRPPSAMIRQQVRITLQPADAPPAAADIARVLDMLGSDDMLLFSTDYPHRQFDGTDAWPAGFPETLKRRVLVDNPRNAYPRLKEALQ